MNQHIKQKAKKTLQQLAFVAGLTATTVPATISGIHFGKNTVQLEDIKKEYKGQPYEVIIKAYNREQSMQGAINGLGLGLITGILYSKIVLSIANKNKTSNEFEEWDADEYLTTIRKTQNNYSPSRE